VLFALFVAVVQEYYWNIVTDMRWWRDSSVCFRELCRCSVCAPRSLIGVSGVNGSKTNPSGLRENLGDCLSHCTEARTQNTLVIGARWINGVWRVGGVVVSSFVGFHIRMFRTQIWKFSLVNAKSYVKFCSHKAVCMLSDTAVLHIQRNAFPVRSFLGRIPFLLHSENPFYWLMS
jgi:hypothetical protein